MLARALGQSTAGGRAAREGRARRLVAGLAVAMVVSGPASPPRAAAQSTNVLPDLSTGTATFDPARVGWLPAEARSAYGSAAEKLKTGELDALVLVAAPEGAAWTLNVAPKGMADYNPSESARQALEICEYKASRPCAILSVNGFEARTAASEPPAPQPMLAIAPADFDATRLPFVPSSQRAAAAAYLSASGPRAFAVTTSGRWMWRGGASVEQAIANTMADCADVFRPAACVLYAVGGRVVFAAQ